MKFKKIAFLASTACVLAAPAIAAPAGSRQALEQSFDPQTEQLETVSLKPTKANIAVKVLTLAWAPYWDDKPAWE